MSNGVAGKITLAASQQVKERDYWLEQLSGHLEKSNFPYDWMKHIGKRKMDSVKFCIEGELFSNLNRLSGGIDKRLHIILTAALLVLLEKYTANNDIIVGAPIYIQDLDGEFINTVLVLRNKINTDITFKELLLQDLRRCIIDATQNQNYPIETLLYKLGKPISKDDEFPLFDVILMLENVHDRKYINHIITNTVFSFLKKDQLIEGTMEYNSSRYKRFTVERIVEHFLNVLKCAISNVNLKVSEINILSAEEQQQLLVDFNRTSTAFERNKTIPELFEEQVEKTPDKIAVVGRVLNLQGYPTLNPGEALNEDGRGDNHLHYLNYKELNKRANQVAHRLRTKGVTPDNLVGIMLERSVEVIVGNMAILKAGGAYLPLDPDFPPKKILSILKNSQCHLLFTSGRNIINDYSGNGRELIDIGTEEIYNGDTANPERINKPENLAYVIYTSGSTGEPKGVMVEHKNLNNLVVALNRAIYRNYSQYLNVCLISPFVFDASVKQIFGALLQGHGLFIVPNEVRIDAERLLNFYRKHSIDISDGTPAHIRMLTEAMMGNSPGPAAKHFLIGGEALSWKTVNDFFSGFSPLIPLPRITNVYGPTECCVDTTAYAVPGGNIDPFADVPIGNPLPNCKVYILDNNKKLVPVGVSGELCISGAGVGKGYLQDEELTRKKFIPNPFESNDKIYCTGDLGRWLPDGTIMFVGRKDQQVKIRGYRIELEEIEKQLLHHKDLKKAVVRVREDREMDKYLCAYVVCVEKNGKKFDPVEMKEYLSMELPEYMVPTCFVQLEKMPLTPNGKVDYRALPKPKIEDNWADYAAPRDDLDRRLIELWSDLLKVEPEKIGIDTNFFEIGGHSLWATILISKIHKVFETRIALNEIFTNPTIRGISRYIRENAKYRFSFITPVEKREYYPLSSAQKRLYVHKQMDPNSTTYNLLCPVLLEGLLDLDQLRGVFLALINRHESLRTSFEIIDGIPRQKIADSAPFVLEEYKIEEKRVIDFAREHFVKPFDLTKPPLLRVGVIKVGENRHIMVVNLYHIIADGTSIGILMKEFMQLYKGETLPALQLRYVDYSQWQKSEEQKNIEKKQEQYWLKQFEKEIPKLNMPIDFPRPSIQSFEGSIKLFNIGADETRKIKELISQEEVTLYMFLLAAFNVFLFKITGQEDILVGTPIANRRHADLQPIVGMFANILVMRNYPGRNKFFQSFLQEIKRRTLDAFDNQDYKLEDLMDIVIQKKDISRNSLFDVSFSLQNMEFQEIRNSNLRMTSLEAFLKASRFDLSFVVFDNGERLNVLVEYCTRLFKEETIQMFIENFNEIIVSILENIDVLLKYIEISSVDIVTAKICTHQLNQLNQLEVGF
ncbi:amino acid adenylation domain-containing protein [Acidobacteriota bacterium]